MKMKKDDLKLGARLDGSKQLHEAPITVIAIAEDMFAVEEDGLVDIDFWYDMQDLIYFEIMPEN